MFFKPKSFLFVRLRSKALTPPSGQKPIDDYLTIKRSTVRQRDFSGACIVAAMALARGPHFCAI